MSARQGSSLWEGWEREAGSRGDAGGAEGENENRPSPHAPRLRVS